MAAAAFWIAMGHAVREPAICKRPLPPLAGLMGEVTVGRQHLDETGMLVKCGPHRRIQCRTIFAAIHIVAGNAVLKRIEPRSQRSKRRSTKWRGNVPTFEYETAAGQLVQMRCLDIGMAHEAIVHPCLVITQDKHDVGSL